MRPSKRLPILGQTKPVPESPADDPLVLLRGGRFARVFAVSLAVVGLVWIASAKVRARSLEQSHVYVHTQFAAALTPKVDGMATALAVPPKPTVEEIPNNSGTPPKPVVEDLPANAGTPPMPVVEDLPANAGTPPMPAVEGLPANFGSTPPMPVVEDLPANAGSTPPMPVVEEVDADTGDSVDRFGRRRTKTGALVLDESESDTDAGGLGLPSEHLGALDAGGFFDPGAFGDAKVVKRKAYVHLMPGIPNEVFFASAVLILLLSFTLFERKKSNRNPRERRYWKRDLMRAGWVSRMVKSRWFQPAIQLPVVIGFIAVIVIGLVGSQEPGRNLAPVLTWNVWWIGLIFMVLVFGNLWCMMCPWTAIPDWVMRRSLTAVRPVASLNRKYPRFKMWMWPAIILFAFVTWLEIVFDAANRPWLTSVFAIFMVVLSWLLLVIYERKAMCRYVCFVGRVSGQYAMMGMLELRRRDNETCRNCKTKDCFHGNDRGHPCPTHEFMGAMNENQYCTLCTECVKSCPEDNISLNVRTSGADVLHPHRSKIDEAYMAILIFIVSAFHGAAMIPLWMEWENALRGAVIDGQLAVFGSDILGFGGSHGGTMTFTLMMLACIVVPGAIFWGLCWLMRMASGRPDITTRSLFIKFSYTLLPIALFYHLAHNAVHVFWEWSKLRRLVSDPLGWGHDWFGTARAPLTALWSPESIWYIQVGLVIIGHIYGIYVAQRAALRIYKGDRRAGFRVHLVMMVGMIAMSLLSLWLLAQPMFMRTADI